MMGMSVAECLFANLLYRSTVPEAAFEALIDAEQRLEFPVAAAYAAGTHCIWRALYETEKGDGGLSL